MEAEDNSDEQEPRPPPSLPDSFPTSDDEINDSLWSLLTDTNFDISAIGEEQEPEPEPPTHPSPEESDVEEDLPEPVFDVTQNKGGKKKISLIIGCHIFKRRKVQKNGNLTFTCNGCEKEGLYLSAVVGVEDEEADKYFVIRDPGMKDHKCWASSYQVDIRAAKSQMYEMVAKEPTRSLLEIYEVVRQKYTAQMDPDSKLLFLQEFPSFLDLKTALLAQRRKFIPPDPNSSRNK